MKGATYYAYYPYQKDLKGEFTSVSDSDTAEEFFANVISNWSPNSDQSIHAKYTVQDLMIAKGTMTPNAKSLSFSMEHQMAFVVIDLPRIIEYEFKNTNPTIPKYIIDVTDVIFNEFKPYRMKDGSLISGSAESLTPAQQAACIGIVFWVGDATAEDTTLGKDHPNCTHGLVVALNDVERKPISWQNFKSSVQDWLEANPKEEYLPVRSNDGPTDPANNIQGYNNTKAIEEFNAANPNNIVIAVEKVDDYRKRILAPATSSDWYLPSAKELALLCGKEQQNLNIVQSNYGTENKALINGKINLIGSIATIISGVYWGSTNTLGNDVFTVNFSEGRSTYTSPGYNYRVRCVFAF